MDDKIKRLANVLGVPINPAGLRKWQDKHHADAGGLLDAVIRRPPLVVLSGDDGSGKTELAETIGDKVARQENIDITLLRNGIPRTEASKARGSVFALLVNVRQKDVHFRNHARTAMATQETTRTARVEARIAPDSLAVVRRAAELQGRSISDFLVAAALKDAHQTIEDAQIIRLSMDDQQRFAELLLSPPPLAPAMQRAIKARKRLITDSK